MKYYRLERSVDTKVIGRHAIQLTFADKKSQDSCWSLVDEEFPNFKPDLRFDLERANWRWGFEQSSRSTVTKVKKSPSKNKCKGDKERILRCHKYCH